MKTMGSLGYACPKVLLLLLIACVCLLEASNYEGNLCYQCSYTRPQPSHKIPAYVSYDPYHRKRITLERPTGPGPFQRTYITRSGRGGWDECGGYLYEPAASRAGVDVWHCPGNCYTRLDVSGNLMRGCYSGEYGINQDLIGCYIQQGHIYCFCQGDRCNRHYIPYYYYYILYYYGYRPPPAVPGQGNGNLGIIPLQQSPTSQNPQAPPDPTGIIPPEFQDKLPVPIEEDGNIRVPVPIGPPEDESDI